MCLFASIAKYGHSDHETKITIEFTWGEWAIAMHGRYESHVLFISFTDIYYVDI